MSLLIQDLNFVSRIISKQVFRSYCVSNISVVSILIVLAMELGQQHGYNSPFSLTFCYPEVSSAAHNSKSKKLTGQKSDLTTKVLPTQKFCRLHKVRTQACIDTIYLAFVHAQYLTFPRIPTWPFTLLCWWASSSPWLFQGHHYLTGTVSSNTTTYIYKSRSMF